MHGEIHNGVFFPDAEHYLSEKVTKADLQLFFSHPVAVDYNRYGHLPERLIATHLMSPEAQEILDAEGATIGDVFHQRVWPMVYMKVFALWNKALGKDVFGLLDEATEVPVAEVSPVASEPTGQEQESGDNDHEEQDEQEEGHEEQDEQEGQVPARTGRGRRKATSEKVTE